MSIRRGFVFIVILTSLFLNLSGQLSSTADEHGSGYVKGIALFEKEKYFASVRLLDAFINSDEPALATEKTEAEYYAALASIRASSPESEFRVSKFIDRYPDYPGINKLRFELANYFYQNKSYRLALKYYSVVDRLYLEGPQLHEYFFKDGYSNFMSGDRGRALLMFSEIKDVDTEYTTPSLYYFSHIAYEEKKYQTALDGFIKLKDDVTFGSVVPFYLVQIYYLQKNYDAILELAPALINSAGKTRAVELYRFIGDAYFNKGSYDLAIQYLEKYSAEAKASAREDKYQLAFCYYKTGAYDKAIKSFLEIGARQDLLSQNIWYLLGDSYLRTGNKERAKLAFSNASRMNYDKTIKEESLFNFAKLTYETSYSPFGEVIEAFREYLDQYPGSNRVEEVYNYLVATYMEIKNYKAALESLDKIVNRDKRLEEAYQRVAFFRGLELYKNLGFDESVDMFGKSLKYGNYNITIRARSLYWRGEANFRLGRYDDAIADYEEFMGMPGAGLLDEYKLVRYNLGYSYFSKKDYSKALVLFTSFEQSAAEKPDIITDARLRIADCNYVSTAYQQAILYYTKVIDYGKADADYAMFQKAFSMGLINDHRGKADNLTSLLSKFPRSSYAPNSYYERGRAYVVLKDDMRGEADFNNVIKSFPNSQFVPKAIVQLGLLFYNRGETEKAIAQYKKVIENYKSTPEARSALTGLKTAYSEINDVESYFSYIKTQDGYGDINMAEKDSMLYYSGENLYISGNYQRASEVLNSYVTEFANGAFRANAQYYLAESLFKNGKKEEALKGYMAVSQMPVNEFTERSLISIGSIYYEDEDYESALKYYKQLETVAEKPENVVNAISGQLNSAYQLGDAQQTIESARKLLAAGSISEESARTANFLIAKAHYSLNEMDEALKFFRLVGAEVTSSEGAESKFRVAEILYKKGLTAESEKTITEFINKNSPHQYWMARVFLLLAEISVKNNDTIQAKATLQSLLDYYSIDDDGILDEAKSLMDSINRQSAVDADIAGNKTDSTQIELN